MLNEVKFSKYVDTGGYVSEIDLGTIIRRKPVCYCRTGFIRRGLGYPGISLPKVQGLVSAKKLRE